jgi:hypothetical protein
MALGNVTQTINNVILVHDPDTAIPLAYSLSAVLPSTSGESGAMWGAVEGQVSFVDTAGNIYQGFVHIDMNAPLLNDQ